MKRKQPATDSGPLHDLRAELTGAARGSKSSIARVLSILKSRGQLVDDRLGGTRELGSLISAPDKHGNAKTPYGTVVQRTKLTDNYILEFVHPCAYFYYLSVICEDFSRFLIGILDTSGARPLHIIVYGDEMTPVIRCGRMKAGAHGNGRFRLSSFRITSCTAMLGGSTSQRYDHRCSRN